MNYQGINLSSEIIELCTLAHQYYSKFFLDVNARKLKEKKKILPEIYN